MKRYCTDSNISNWGTVSFLPVAQEESAVAVREKKVNTEGVRVYLAKFITRTLRRTIVMKKTKNLSIIVALTVFICLLAAGCSSGKKQTVSETKMITITDSSERTVEVPCPPERIVVCNSYVAEVICVLEEEDRIIGASKVVLEYPILDQKLKGIKDVGDVFNPSVEKILTLDPDIVIGWTTQEQDITNQLQQAGIPVVLLDCSKTDVLSRDIKVIGKILGREKRASQFIAYYEKYQEMIGTRLKGVPDEKKPQVYWEGMSDYNTAGPGSSDGNMLVAAGGRNIAGEVPLSSTKVSPEWVLVKNPEIVIKCPGTAKVPSGYGINADAMKKQREEIIVRSELKQIKAFKTDKVYVLSRRAVSGPQSIIGLMYVAKWLHPELFEDVNPEKIHQEMLEKFYGLEYQGAWAYPI